MQHRLKVARNRFHNLMLPGRPFLPLNLLRAWLWEFKTSLLCELFDGIHERQSTAFCEPTDRIAMRAASEAVIKTFLIVDPEARGFFLMKGAAGL
jgi:hypothetical protein